MFRRAACSGGFRWPERDVALVRHPVGVLDGAEAGGDAGFAGGDGLAVAAAVGVFGQGLGVALDFADVGFAFVGVGSDGVDGGAGGGGVQDEGDVWVSGLRLARAMGRGSLVSGQARPGSARRCRVRSWRSLSMVSARSIWSQAAAKFSPQVPGPFPRQPPRRVLPESIDSWTVTECDGLWVSRGGQVGELSHHDGSERRHGSMCRAVVGCGAVVRRGAAGLCRTGCLGAEGAGLYCFYDADRHVR